jgi:WD40 repeat protein
MILLDAYTGEVLHALRDHRPDDDAPSASVSYRLGACFSPCSRYVFSGTAAHAGLACWDADRGSTVSTTIANFEHRDSSPCSALAFSPTHYMMASAGVDTHLWTPKLNDEDGGERKKKKEEEEEEGELDSSAPSPESSGDEDFAGRFGQSPRSAPPRV